MKDAFIQLSHNYDFFMHNLTSDKSDIFRVVYMNYQKASSIIDQMVNSNFDDTSYEDFIKDAQEIATFDQNSILRWNGKEPKVYTMKNLPNLKKSPIMTLFQDGREEYSSITLKWAEAFEKRLKQENIKIEDDHLELFYKLKSTFAQLSEHYLENSRDSFVKDETRRIFIQVSKVYETAKKTMERIINPDQEEEAESTENTGPDAIDALLWLYRIGKISKDEFDERMHVLIENEEREIENAFSSCSKN